MYSNFNERNSLMSSRLYSSIASNRVIRRVALVVLVALIFEIGIFNAPHWESMFFSNRAKIDYSLGEGLQALENGAIRIIDDEKAYLEFNANGTEVKNLYFDVTVPGWNSSSWRNALGPFLSVSVQATDKAHSLPFQLPQYEYVDGILESKYMRLHLSGASELMRLFINEGVGFEFEIQSIAINQVRPFNFIVIRFALLLIIGLTIQLFRPSSDIYKIGLLNSRYSKIVVILLVVVEVVLSCGVSRLSGVVDQPSCEPVINGSTAVDFNQYNHLTNAFLNGEVSLDLPVSTELKKMSNPYDAELRSEVLDEAGEYYFLDYAFYNGEYYSYFGALPALVAFVPFKLITGGDLRTDLAVLLFGIHFTISFNVLIFCLSKKYFEGISLGTWLLVSISFFCGSGLLYLMFLPQLYSIPILLGLSCAFMGLSFWVSAKSQSDRAVSIYRKSYLIAGSTMIALTLGCRPQYILLCLLAFPIFWSGIVRERQFFSVSGTVNTLAVIAPFIVIAIPIMAYNYARFGSLFDFGASFNLTGSDMTARGVDLARSLPALYQYLFQPLNIKATYPYVFGIDMAVDYQGYWFFEPYLGGLFSFAPMLVLCPFSITRVLGRCGTEGKLWLYICLFIAGSILFADFQIASITMRYFSDFAWLLILLTWGSVLLCPSYADKSSFMFLLPILLTATGVLVGFWALLSPDRWGALVSTCPSLYYGLSHFLCLV